MCNLKGLLLTSLFILLGGCKISIEVPDLHGAQVVSTSGAYICTHASEECVIDVVDLFFDETFRALPNRGYMFTGWERRERGLCGGSTEDCRLFTSSFEGIDLLMAVLESDQTYYLEANFAPIEGGVTTMNIVGLWHSATSWGECTVEGTVEFWVDREQGLFWQARAPNPVIVDVETCETVIASETPVLGPVPAITDAFVNPISLWFAWWASRLGYSAAMFDDGTWELVENGGAKQVFTRIE